MIGFEAYVARHVDLASLQHKVRGPMSISGCHQITSLHQANEIHTCLLPDWWAISLGRALKIVLPSIADAFSVKVMISLLNCAARALNSITLFF